MADRRRTAAASTRRSTPRASTRRKAGGFRLTGPNWQISPDVARSLVGIILLILGAVTLIALVLPGQGRLTDLWRDWIAPWFGTGRWLLPFVLLAAGVYVERAHTRPGGWELRLLGAAIAFIASLGLIEIMALNAGTGTTSGGRIGVLLSDLLSALITPPGAFVVLVGIMLGGVLIMLDVGLGTFLAPVGRSARSVREALATSAETVAAPRPDAAQLPTPNPMTTRDRAAARKATADLPVPEARIWDLPDDRVDTSAIPPAIQSAAPVSSTFASSGSVPAPAATAVAVADRPTDAAGPDGSTTSPERDGTKAPSYAWVVPPLNLLDDVAPKQGGATMDHARNAAIITSKLASFNIPVRVDHWNAGPVVTQYEVQPAPEVKVSRIEGLADDLAMALAARTLRIEAPIPGRTVVGLEIPNSDFNVVALRRIAEEADFRNSPSRLTFALGRDVAGHARSVDLAKMPHLLIAGATGSGKSVMVNALIASLLVRATPDEVRMILMDLKRVELAAYHDVPHLKVPVITEPGQAKAALKWAVGEMEYRYRRLAGATARNIAAFNETRVDPADKMPYIVIVIDELADLMMREGKNVEDPIVRLAQKARATGIHMVLATQRPSVNVVTGLIKANFPSRIAFAMASQIDSRTILDTPGAEDLIGRGDMLYQPADLPRPVRLQGVFVSDKEIGAVTDHWRLETVKAQAHGGPVSYYEMSIVDNDEDSVGKVEDQPDEEADRLLPDAVKVIQEYDRASASLLQRRLKIGYARAARIVDQLEARGYVGTFDGSNARPVLRRESGPVAGSGRWSEGEENDG